MKMELRDIFARGYMRLCQLLPMNKKRFVFKSDRGGGCADSPLALFRALKALYPDYEAVWVLKDPDQAPEGATAVRESSLEEIKMLATSAYWVDNKRKGRWAVKRPGQTYIQTWHGPIALKRVERDIEDQLPRYYVKSAKHDSKIADCFLSSSKWTSQFYRSSLWYDGEILEHGVPRSDIFYGDRQKAIEKLRAHFHQDKDVKLALYAPTFRDDGRRNVYDLDAGRLIGALEKRFGGRWALIVRMHPNIAGDKTSITLEGGVLNGNSVDDFNDIILACDFMITDYSSCMFDAMEAGKRVLLYTPDLEAYEAERGFTIPLEELPFEKAGDNDAFVAAVEAFDDEAYRARVHQFCQRIGLINDGSASQKTLERFLGPSTVENQRA